MTSTVSPPDERSAQTRRPTRRSTEWVLFGSVASGIGALAFQAFGVEQLGEAAFAPITVLWTLQYLVATIALYPTEAYITRTDTISGGDPAALRRPLVVIGLWVAALSALCVAVLWALRDGLLGGAGELALAGGLIVAGYGAFYVIRGRMAGANRFRSYGAATALESLARMAVAVPLLLVAPSAGALGWTMPVGVLLVAAWWEVDRRRYPVRFAPPGHPLAAPATDLAPAAAGGFLVATTVANIASQMLLAGGPLVVALLDAPLAERSRYFAVVTAARVPLVLAVGGLLSRLLPPLVRIARAGDDSTLRRLAVLTVPASIGLGLVGAGVGYVLGPTLATVFLRTDRPDATFVALTAFGVLLATGSLLLNQVLIARSSERRLVVPWLVALAVAVAVVVLSPGGPTLRMSIAFVVGETVALTGLLAMVLTAPRLHVSPVPDSATARDGAAVGAAPLAEP